MTSPEPPAPTPGPSNLQLRVLTGVVGIAGLVSALYFTVWGYALVFTGISLLCQWEFYGLLKKNGRHPEIYAGLMLNLGLHGAALAYCLGGDDWQGVSRFLAVALGIAFWIRIFLYKLYRHEEQPFEGIAYTFLGVVYTGLPFILFHFPVLRKSSYSWQTALGVLLLLWAADSGAYFAGRSLGKHKLFERISPKKTWEGFAGGLLASAAVSGILSYYFKDLGPDLWMVVMLLVVILGTFGDLTESMFKRSLSIKDSGSILPGHGGFLDRFDGLLIALPAVAGVLIWFLY